jgi:hypothetical protein
MKKALALVCFAAFILLLASCAPGPNGLAHTPDPAGIVAGFWRGLWHGIIAPITFIVSLFNHSIQMYDVHNNGGWYNFGFLTGLTALWGSGGHQAGRWGRKGSSAN